jgi:UPF0176 protein
MYEVLSFYKYCLISDPDILVLWQKELFERYSLVGRVLVADEGINGTLCGTQENTKKYIKAMKKYTLFGDMPYKKSSSSFSCFEKAIIKKKEEIVVLREDKEAISFRDRAKTITADKLHELLHEEDSNRVLFDTRNAYESRIGKFTGAICPDIKTSRDFAHYFQNNKEKFKNKTVIMQCTAGVRCERISVLCKKHTEAKEVLHLEHGIHEYCRKYPDGFFRGRQYVFDDRISIKINNDVLASCDLCKKPCDRYNNCLHARCNKRYIACDKCLEKLGHCCSETCLKLIKDDNAPCRPPVKSRLYKEDAHVLYK